MADSIDSNVVDEAAEAPEAAPEQGSWIVAAGSVKDAAGDVVRGCAFVAEAGLAEDDAKARAKELSGRALDGATAKCASLVLADEGSFQAAPFEEWFSAKALKERGVPYDEARADADKSAAQDAKPRAVVVAVPLSSAAKAGIAAACVAVVAAIVVACVLAFQQTATLESEVEPASTLEQAHEESSLRGVTFTVKAEGVPIRANVDDPAPVAVQPTYELIDADGEVVQEGEIVVNEMTIFELKNGSYTFELLSAPVLKDGTTYKLPADPIAFEVGAGMDESDFEIELEAIATDDMTKEQLEAVAAELEGAGASDAAATAREHAASAPSVSGSADSVKRPASSGADQPSQGTSGGGSPQQPSQPSNPGTSGGSSEPAPAPDPDPAPAPDPEPETPVHVHDWQPNYVQQQVAYDTWICKKCNKSFNTLQAADDHYRQQALAGDMTHNFTTITNYKTESVQVGEKCSTCGATR